MASSPPPPPIDTTTGGSLSSTVVPRDTGKAPAVEAAVLGGVSSSRVLRSSRRRPAVGGSSSQPTHPNTEFEVPSDVGGDALPPFDAATYAPFVHIIGGGGSLQYRPPLSDALAEVLHREPEQHFGFTNRKANEKLRVWGSGPQTLFCNKENSVHVQFLAALVDLEAIAEFNWGTPALATLYGHLSACSRGVSLSLGGHHRVLEVC
ncbi:hypothetical protein RHMOL_Rhmol10G0235500 [Rhododendron molle]|uniref:Uncharacterized protein n=1 Tax=Rhododendron molle TaxID=49168 RepID=A0ACC0M6M9_RHOML|nr:hypothetical protein RHMOL_Rhmol10G0235500 [Rhododendron molle]